MEIKFDILEYIGKLDEIIYVLLSLNYEDEFYEGVFLYKKEKIIRARKELYDNFINLMSQLKLNTKNSSEKEKILLEKDINSDLKDIYNLYVTYMYLHAITKF